MITFSSSNDRLWIPIMRRVGWAIFVCGLAVSRLGAQAQTPSSRCTIPDFPAPILCARAGLDTVHASYIVLVDESGSMRALWPGVKEALADFARAVPDGDELDVRLFSTSVRSLIVPIPATERLRSDWVKTIVTAPLPNGPHTDLGRAAESALTQIKSAPAERVQFVFFLTDGKQDAESTSPFSTLWGGEWASLASQAKLLTTARPISIAIVRLTSAADQSLLSRTFPSAVTTDAIGSTALRDWFIRTRRDVAVAKLAVLIKRELAQPIALVESEKRLTLHGDRREQYRVKVSNERHILTTLPADDAPIQLSTGAMIDPGVSLWSTHPGVMRLADKRYSLWVPPGSIAETLDERVAVRTRLEPADELSRIGISPAARSDTLHLKLALLAGGPLAAWLYYSICVLLIILLLFLARGTKRAMHSAVLDGRVIVRGADHTSATETHALRGRELKSFTVVTAGGRDTIRLDAKNERGKTVVYATPLATDVTLKNKLLRTPTALTGKTVFAAGSDEITYLLS